MMKRFYDKVSVKPLEGGYGLMLDQRELRSPARKPLIVPTLQMAEAMADEWRAQGDKVDMAVMVHNGFANAAIDRIAADPDHFRSAIAAYGESDCLCYRADPGTALAEHQDKVWEPMLHWAETQYDVSILRIAGVMHQAQSQQTLDRLSAPLQNADSFLLAALTTLVGLTDSLVLTLAILESAFDSGDIWQAAILEELWQEEQWGSDDLALAHRAERKKKFDQALDFLSLCNSKKP